MDCVTPIVSCIKETLMVQVKKQLDYLFSSTEHVRKMKTRMEELDKNYHDVKRRMQTNKIRNLEIPTGVPGWLTNVEKIKETADGISSTECFNIIMRHRAGMNAFETTEVIESLTKTNNEMKWDDAKKFPGEADANNASFSAPSYEDAQNHFKSNEKPFNDALEYLQPDHKIQVIALYGMGGVGKSTMMENLKKTLEDRKTYDQYMKEVIGQTGELFNIQQSMAEYLTLSLTDMDPTLRAKRLRIAFTNLPEGKRKVLVILDDVWKTIKLNDIGLNPLPNGIKLLLTSRNEDTCRQIAAEANFDLKPVKVELMKEHEAQNLFWQIAGDENKNYQQLKPIGTEIVRECGFFPLAINIVASFLRLQFEEKESVWKDTLRRLKNNELEEKVQKSIKISYDHIKDDEKVIFLLCGLFRNDYNIPIEELTRYAWGLQLLNKVYTLVEARNSTKTCVQSLRKANLLMESDYLGCVKMHDLVLDFVIGIVSNGDYVWLINHGDISKWSKAERRESCKRISITCAGMFEFPTD